MGTPFPTPEEDVNTLLTLLKGKKEGVRTSALLNNHFRTSHNGLNRLIKAVRTSKANLEIYPPKGTGHHVPTLFHPEIQPFEDPKLTKNRDIVTLHENGTPLQTIARKHNIPSRYIKRIVNKQKQVETIRSKILGNQLHRREEKTEHAREHLPILRNTQHTKSVSDLANKLVGLLQRKGPLSRNTIINSRVLTPKALDAAHEHAVSNNMVTVTTKPTKTKSVSTIYSLPEQQPKENYMLKYKVELPARSHPAISGTELESYMRHMANKYQNDEHLPAMIHEFLSGGSPDREVNTVDPSSLFGINDRLQELGEPVPDYYDLPKAAGDLHLDNAMNTILNSAVHARQRRFGGYNEDGEIAVNPPPQTYGEEENGNIQDRRGTTEELKSFRRRAIYGLMDYVKFKHPIVSYHLHPAKEGIDLLRSQGHSDEDLFKSLKRHQFKNEFDTNQKHPEPAIAQAAMLPANNEYIKARRYKLKSLVLKYLQSKKQSVYSKSFIDSLPIKYRNHPSVSSFIQAIRQLRSRNQEVRREVPAVQYQKMAKLYPNARIKVQHILDSIADSPQSSSANTAHVLQHSGDRDPVMAAIALVAHQLNSSYLALHEHPEGPDTLYQFDVNGGADQFRQAMDAADLNNRNFIQKPDQTGWWPMVYDKGNKLKERVEQFAQANKLPLNATRGTGEFVGQQQAAEMDGKQRNVLLDKIKHFEKHSQFPLESQ
jgi:hypothetical protein